MPLELVVVDTVFTAVNDQLSIAAASPAPAVPAVKPTTPVPDPPRSKSVVRFTATLTTGVSPPEPSPLR